MESFKEYFATTSLQLPIVTISQPADNGLHANLENKMLLHDDDNFMDCDVFYNESTFHLWKGEQP